MNVTTEHDDHDEKPGFAWKSLGKAFIIIALLAACAGAYSYVYNQRPDLYKQIRVKLDRFGLVQPDPLELQRISDINKLSISYEEKQILINRTIFMGATPQMVLLALGKPKEGRRIAGDRKGQESVILVYHLPEELRPTMLRFDDGKLTQAYKGSSIDFEATPASYHPTQE